jgi:hypothetical protein
MSFFSQPQGVAVSDADPGHRDAQQQHASRGNGIADQVADDRGQRGGGPVELRAPPPLVIVLVVVPALAAAVVVLLSHVVRFT